MQDPQASIGQAIHDDLDAVARERAHRAGTPGLAERVLALKTFQQDRFRRGYHDLLAHPRFGGAARFFLEELYGPRDFTRRDAQFQRIVRPLVRLFPAEVVQTVAHLGALHALSERLDTRMAEQVPARFSPADYVQAWCRVGEPAARAQQVELVLAVGRALDIYTRKPLLRGMLHMMRRPAQMAGLGELQAFLECGFDTFKAMGGAQTFLELIAQREADWAAQLFAGDAEGRFTGLFG
ncbi:MAG: hypothetical protein J0L58_10230 [Burkholderiales bacterium]|nr:hypothetical protein [Burkholderiales bacterium]